MSFALINEAIAMPLPPARRMVLLQLSRMANQAGACWPSVQTLARQCCLSVRSVFNHLAALAKAGLIQRRNRLGRSTVYTVTAPVASSDPAASATQTGQPSVQPAPASPGETTGEAMGETQTILRQEPSVSAPEPVREPLPKPTRTPVPAAVSTVGLTVGSVVQAMRAAGLLGAYATPSLATLVATASGPHEFSEAASQASKRGKGLAWALARVAGKRQDGRQDAAASASSPPPVVHADQARTTVPSRPGRDPVLVQIERDAALAVPPPAGVREQLARLRAQIVQSISRRKTG
jgi:hypothetical protein